MFSTGRAKSVAKVELLGALIHAKRLAVSSNPDNDETIHVGTATNLSGFRTNHAGSITPSLPSCFILSQ